MTNIEVIKHLCICLEHIHDNGACPVHGEPPKSVGTNERTYPPTQFERVDEILSRDE